VENLSAFSPENEGHLWEAIFNAIPDPLMVLDTQQQIRYCNQSMRDLLDCQPQEFLPQSCYSMAHIQGQPPDSCPVLRLNSEETSATSIVFIERVAQYYQVTASALKDTQGNLIGCVHLARNITQIKANEQEMRIKDNAMASSSNAIAIVGLDGILTYVNPAFMRMWGYERDDQILGKNVNETWHNEALAREVIGILYSAGCWVNEIRSTRADGTPFDVRIIAEMVRDENGAPLCMMASFIDITDSKRAEAALRESEERYRNIIEQSLQGIIVRQDDRVVLVNEAYAKILGCSQEELLNQSATESMQAIHPDDRLLIQQHYHERLAGKTVPNRYVYRLATCTGKLVWVEAAVNTIQYRGKPAQLSMVLDFTERKLAEEELIETQRQLKAQLKEIQALQVQLREEAIRDPLTGLFNRRYMEETLPREIDQARRMQTQVGMIMFDLDYFKRFNDAYGHPSGDLVLKELGFLLVSRFRLGDIPCRYGGEEFVVILPGTSLKDALERAEEIRQMFGLLVFKVDENTEISVTLSGGVSAYPVHGDNPAAILNRADQALYRAKHNGRNQVIAFDA
jgi:diguanylate cyclase (GGDEF)-like protein/PAS domain S-box-containing protein